MGKPFKIPVLQNLILGNTCKVTYLWGRSRYCLSEAVTQTSSCNPSPNAIHLKDTKNKVGRSHKNSFQDFPSTSRYESNEEQSPLWGVLVSHLKGSHMAVRFSVTLDPSVLPAQSSVCPWRGDLSQRRGSKPGMDKGMPSYLVPSDS